MTRIVRSFTTWALGLNGMNWKKAECNCHQEYVSGNQGSRRPILVRKPPVPAAWMWPTIVEVSPGPDTTFMNLCPYSIVLPCLGYILYSRPVVTCLRINGLSNVSGVDLLAICASSFLEDWFSMIALISSVSFLTILFSTSSSTSSSIEASAFSASSTSYTSSTSSASCKWPTSQIATTALTLGSSDSDLEFPGAWTWMGNMKPKIDLLLYKIVCNQWGWFWEKIVLRIRWNVSGLTSHPAYSILY